MTLDGFCCVLGFQNLPGEDPRTPYIIRPNKNISVVRVTCQKKLGRVGREKTLNKIQASYTLEGTVLENVDNIKYLGVTITGISRTQDPASRDEKIGLGRMVLLRDDSTDARFFRHAASQNSRYFTLVLMFISHRVQDHCFQSLVYIFAPPKLNYVTGKLVDRCNEASREPSL